MSWYQHSVTSVTDPRERRPSDNKSSNSKARAWGYLNHEGVCHPNTEVKSTGSCKARGFPWGNMWRQGYKAKTRINPRGTLCYDSQPPTFLSPAWKWVFFLKKRNLLPDWLASAQWDFFISQVININMIIHGRIQFISWQNHWQGIAQLLSNPDKCDVLISVSWFL